MTRFEAVSGILGVAMAVVVYIVIITEFILI